MIVGIFSHAKTDPKHIKPGKFREAVRIEVDIPGMPAHHRLVVLDADDTFDVIIEDETGARECLWSAVKDPEL